uniref:Uncharacterized protein n=1 Tax=Acrobeloides nanus TaxID=290746 RepID=A0A914CDB9_9BILA
MNGDSFLSFFHGFDWVSDSVRMLHTYEKLLCLSVFLFASINAFSTDEEGELITLRTKRQQCVCVTVNPRGQQLQCECNNANSPNVPQQQSQLLTPQQQQLNQQDLQQELGQLQAGQCGCVTILINGISAGSNPQYMCDCGATGQPGQPQYNPTNPTSSTAQPTTTSSTTTTTTTTTTTSTTTPSPIFSTTPQRPQFSNTGATLGSNNPCACICISVVNGQSTYSCNCNGNTNQIRQQDQPLSQALSLAPTLQTIPPTSVTPNVVQQNPTQSVAGQVNAGQSFLSSVLGQSNYFANMAGNLQGIIPSSSTTQASLSTQNQLGQQQNPSLYTNNYIAHDQSKQYNEPATTTCVTISVPANSQVCVCGENYVQCADNMCCHKRYRSMKESKSENAVDLIVDVIRNIKNKLMGRH